MQSAESLLSVYQLLVASVNVDGELRQDRGVNLLQYFSRLTIELEQWSGRDKLIKESKIKTNKQTGNEGERVSTQLCIFHLIDIAVGLQLPGFGVVET